MRLSIIQLKKVGTYLPRYKVSIVNQRGGLNIVSIRLRGIITTEDLHAIVNRAIVGISR